MGIDEKNPGAKFLYGAPHEIILLHAAAGTLTVPFCRCFEEANN